MAVRTMHFLVSLLNFRPGRIGGAETYIRGLLEAMPAVAGNHRLGLLCADDLRLGEATAGWEVHRLEISERAATIARLAEAFARVRPRALERRIEALGADAILFPQQSMFPLSVETPSVLTVVDLQHLEAPANVGLAERAFRARIYPTSLARARHIVAISDFTAQALRKHYGDLGNHLRVIRLAAPSIDVGRVQPLRPVDDPFLFYPAASFAHKGHEDLFGALAAMAARGSRPALVLTGHRTRYWNRLERCARRAGIAGQVHHLGHLPYGNILGLYAACHAAIFPSRHEGFGLPVVEAARMGCRIVTSRLPVFEELGVPQTNRIDFRADGALAAALETPRPTPLGRPLRDWTDVATETLEALISAATSN